MSDFLIRKGVREDCPQILELIKELARYEKASHEVTNTQEQLEKDGFEGTPLFECLVAEVNGVVVGLSLWYYRYSTWKGKRLYLEDIIVTKSHRSKGIGKSLFDKTVAFAKEKSCTGMTWLVLDWNSPAIKFYDKYGTFFDDEWNVCNLHFNN